MADPTPRRVRLPRSAASGGPGGPSPGPRPEGAGFPPVPGPERRRVPNRAAMQRARRLTLIYVVALAALYLGFSILARGTAGGGSAGSAGDLRLFGAVALVLAFAGAFLTLGSAPSAVELGDGPIVIVGAYGTRRTFRRGPELSVRVVRRYPAGWLSPGPVESTEIVSGGVRRTYLLDAGTLAATGGPGPD